MATQLVGIRMEKEENASETSLGRESRSVKKMSLEDVIGEISIEAGEKLSFKNAKFTPASIREESLKTLAFTGATNLGTLVTVIGHSIPSWAGLALSSAFPGAGGAVGMIIYGLAETTGLTDIIGYVGTGVYLYSTLGGPARNELFHLMTHGEEGVMLMSFLGNMGIDLTNWALEKFAGGSIPESKALGGLVTLIVLGSFMTSLSQMGKTYQELKDAESSQGQAEIDGTTSKNSKVYDGFRALWDPLKRSFTGEKSVDEKLFTARYGNEARAYMSSDEDQSGKFKLHPSIL